MPFFNQATNTDASQSTFNDVAGDQMNTITRSNIHNVNSGNTTNTTVSDSYNDSSVNSGHKPKKSWQASPENGKSFNVIGGVPQGVQGLLPTPASVPLPETPQPQRQLEAAPAPAATLAPSPTPEIELSQSIPEPKSAPPAISTPGHASLPSSPPAVTPALKSAESATGSSAGAKPLPLSANVPPQKVKESKTGDRIDAALGISEFVLSTLQTAAQLAPVPFLSEAAGLALGILNNVQGAKDNKEGFLRLASDACGLVYSVVIIYKEQEREGKTMPEALNANLGELVGTLKHIDEFARKQTKRNFFVRMTLSKAHAGTITVYREKLRQALDIFWLQSSIHVRENLTRIAEQQGKMYQALQNGSSNSPGTTVAPSQSGTRQKSRPVSISSPSSPSVEDKLAVMQSIDYSHGVFNNVGGNQSNVTHHH